LNDEHKDGATLG